MASDARLSLPCRLPAALRRSPLATAAAASTSPRCRVLTTAAAVPARPRPRCGRWRAHAAEDEAQGQVQQQQDDEVVASNVLPYCSIDRKQKKTIREMEQVPPGAAGTPSPHTRLDPRIFCYFYLYPVVN
ncbi:hypothetical protein GQ55_3G368000 [Panicum hallii var. hallii]|uniref:Uncharacterized protein n=1 Tax=Panicum hallii var. hallii TaxID=1504633 RepID=A0A2T7EG71_9POAL|nr:hypothetical protein GQ55_3G368000 [Panicum hallii var. hallii]